MNSQKHYDKWLADAKAVAASWNLDWSDLPEGWNAEDTAVEAMQESYEYEYEPVERIEWMCIVHEVSEYITALRRERGLE